MSDRDSRAPVLRYVAVREGSTPAWIPGDVARALGILCEGTGDYDRVLDFAALILVRLGTDGGTHLLRHLTAHSPALLRDADPALAAVLAESPELITGPLRG